MERGKHFHKYNYVEDNKEVWLPARQRGTNRIRLQPHITDDLEYKLVYFGFTKLTTTGGLFPEVQRKPGNTKICNAGPVKRK
jgi:hypothetical protein